MGQVMSTGLFSLGQVMTSAINNDQVEKVHLHSTMSTRLFSLGQVMSTGLFSLGQVMTSANICTRHPHEEADWDSHVTVDPDRAGGHELTQNVT